jgi:DNA-binding response OmpR family regulator
MLVAVESAPPSPSKYESAGSILVVDDENASGELIATLLRSQGYAVRLAHDGQEALPIIARGGVDLLLLDLMMSKMDGVEVCSHVRNQLRDAFMPIVITTSLTDRESRIRAKEAGADDVLVKPVDGLELLVRIDSLLRQRAHVSQLRRERDREHDELLYARSVIQAQQRTLRSIEGASATLSSMLERQRRSIESAKKRWLHIQEAREELARFAQLGAELASGLEQLTSAATGTVVRMPEVDASNDQHDDRVVAATARK